MEGRGDGHSLSAAASESTFYSPNYDRPQPRGDGKDIPDPIQSAIYTIYEALKTSYSVDSSMKRVVVVDACAMSSEVLVCHRLRQAAPHFKLQLEAGKADEEVV